MSLDVGAEGTAVAGTWVDGTAEAGVAACDCARLGAGCVAAGGLSDARVVSVAMSVDKSGGSRDYE